MKDINDVSTEWLGNILAGNILPTGDQAMQLARIVMEVKLASPEYYAYFSGGKYEITRSRDVAEQRASKKGTMIKPLYGLPV